MRDPVLQSRIWMTTFFVGALSVLLLVSGCSNPDKKEEKEEPDEVPAPKLVEKTPDPDGKAAADAGQEAVFMGTRARGRRFCIIADASNSMAGIPIKQVKREMLKTINALDANSRFYLIFFNVKDIPMPESNWLHATKENVDKITPWVERMTLALHTNPGSSFDRAFKLEPKPDVIFFMTDGFFKDDVPAQLKRINATEPRTTVHTILFTKQKKAGADKKVAAAKKAANKLQQIADENNGTFRHVEQE